MLWRSSRKAILGPARNRAADIVIAMYGQSNMLFMSGTSSSPPSANAGTRYFDGDKWGAVPSGNGVREMLNGVNSATGLSVGAFNGAVSGVDLIALSKGNKQGLFTGLAKQIMLSGGIVDYIVWNQGEGDSADGTSEAAYLAMLDQLHADICAIVGKTKAQIPLFVSGLGTTTAPSGTGYGTHASWEVIQRAIIDAASLPNTFYSHSNRDRVLTDGIHGDGASMGRSGKRFARSITTFRGATSGQPHWAISSAAVVDATTTTVDLVHSLGTDFTPTSGITGFEVSGDNGGSWNAPSAAVRTSATRVTLTHSSLATTNARKLRYQYGLLPDVSACVLDNSSLAIPLDNSAGIISPTPLATLPTPTYISGGVSSGGGGVTQTYVATIAPGASPLLVIFSAAGSAATGSNLNSATVTPNVGTAITATKITTNGSNPGCALFQAQLLSDAATATSVTITLNFASSPFASNAINVWTVPSGDLTSTTATGVAHNEATGATTVATTVNAASGGFIIAAGFTTSSTATAVISGTETFAERYDANNLNGSAAAVADDASNVATNASSSVSVTFTVSGNPRIVAGAWR